jgi:glycosyltransferase involved in cell wall biosynthesis
MRVIFCHPYAYTDTEGLDRAVINLAQGLQAEGIEIVFVSLQITSRYLNLLKKIGSVYYEEIRDKPLGRHELGMHVYKDIFLKNISKRLSNLLKKLSFKEKDESVLIMAQEIGFDALIRAAKKGIFGAVGWWAFGTPHLYPVSRPLRESFEQYVNLGFEAFSVLTPILNRYFWELENLDFIIAGSQFIGHILNYFGGFHCLGPVYPPVDTRKFRPNAIPSGKYIFSIGSSKDIIPWVVSKIAHRVPVIKAGSFKVDGAKNVGYVSDEELVSLYSNAKFTIYPQRIEQYGLPVAESLASGTPVLTFNWQGPSELIIENVTGWKVNTPNQFYEKALSLFKEGYDVSIRQKSRKFAEEKLSIEASTKKFLAVLDEII